jgi:DNA-3-methyladenine glycosylase I
MTAAKKNYRCKWCESSDLMRAYHDKEWGVPLHNDRKLFEFMVLDAFQAGLSWSTIINKRKNFEKAFENFEPEIVAEFDEDRIQMLMLDSGIIRNQQKIRAAVTNARHFLRIQKEYGSFDKYIWQFTGHKTIYNHLPDESHFRAKSPESDAMSKALIKEGFKFVGSTICYAFMQAAGMIHDHVKACHRYKEGD